MNKTTKLILALLLLAVAASAAVIFLREGGGTTAVITRNGTVLHEIRLDTLTEPKTFRIEGENGAENLIRAERNRICMESASCPDQICVHQGYIADGTVPIVCLPNKVIIEIKGGGDGLDAANG